MALDSRLQDSTYRNWVRATLGLKYLKQGLTPFVVDQVACLHAACISCVHGKRNTSNVQCACSLKTLLPAHVANNTPCPHPGTCCCFKRNKASCPKGICGELYDTVVSEHNLNNPIWNNTDSLKWTTSQWELAKCFLSSSGYKDTQTADECDASGLLSICMNCKSIRSKISDISQFEKARTARNDILHSSMFELEDAALVTHIGVMLAVLNDPIIQQQQQSDAAAALTHLQEILTDERVINKDDETKARETALASVNARIIEIDQLMTSDTRQKEEELKQIQSDLIKTKGNHDDFLKTLKRHETDIQVLYSSQDATDARHNTLETSIVDMAERINVIEKRQADPGTHHAEIVALHTVIENRQEDTKNYHAEIGKGHYCTDKRQNDIDQHHVEIGVGQGDIERRQVETEKHHAEIGAHQDTSTHTQVLVKELDSAALNEIGYTDATKTASTMAEKGIEITKTNTTDESLDMLPKMYDEFEPWSPRTVETASNMANACFEPSHRAEHQEAEFDSWSQEFESDVLVLEDMASASLACLQDGEFKTEKTYYCPRCRSRFSGYKAYSRHRETHTRTSPESMEAGPSVCKYKR